MERRTQNPPLFRQAISHSLQAEHALEGEDGDGESSATKDLTFLVARALAAATIACSAHITITTGGNQPSHPVLGEAWTRDASRPSINSRV
jgi:hypothetical protein